LAVIRIFSQLAQLHEYLADPDQIGVKRLCGRVFEDLLGSAVIEIPVDQFQIVSTSSPNA
jgi:hypothetical protein